MCIKKPNLRAVFLFLIFLANTTFINKNIFAGSILENGKKIYSQFDEELIIRDFFNDRRDGIFVDIGCADYKDDSTTYYLEKHLGWSGIAVDALAEFGLGYIENRPKTRFLNFIVTDHSWAIEQFYRMPATGLSSVSKDASLNWAKEFKTSKQYKIIYVPTITVTDLLQKNMIEKIDFISIDTGAGTMEVLNGFDIERFKPELVCIEGGGDELNNYFLSHNYEHIDKYSKYDNINQYYKPKNK